MDANSIKAIFLAALDKTTPAERAAFLDEACVGDSSLRRRVESLLNAHDQPDPLLDQQAGPLAAEGGFSMLDFLEPSENPGSLGRLAHYEVLETIGHGGMGVVLRAFDEKLHRIVAIKALSPLLAGHSAARMRFVREARATAAVTHENVVGIYAVEEDGPVPYLVMQYVHGRTLQEKLEATGPLPLNASLRIGLQIAEGLAAAHRQGLIHRDIKPANILLENGVERVKITDFGLARAVDDASLTQSGAIAGTPTYMSPEQAGGEQVDHRSDLFSLGSVLYALCAGHPPFRASSSVAVLKRICEETPRPLRQLNPDVPVGLEEIVNQLHAKAPTDRFDTAAEVATLLSGALAQLQAGAAPDELMVQGVERTKATAEPRPRSVRFLPWAAAGLVLVALVSVGWFIRAHWSARPIGTGGGGNEVTHVQPNAAERNGMGGDSNEERQPQATPAEPVVLKPSRTLSRHTDSLRFLAISLDGLVLASGGADRHIFLWDTETWQVRGPLEGHAGDVVGLAFSPDNSRLASVTSSGDSCLIRLWDVATAQPVGTLGEAGPGMWAVAYSPDGKTLACGGWDKELHLFDVATGTERLVISDVNERLLRVLSFSPDGAYIATGGVGPARAWDTVTGHEFATDEALPDRMGPIFLPGGKQLAGWSYSEGKVTLCEFPSGRVRAAWRAHRKTIEALAVSPDGRFLASVGGDGVGRVWSTVDQRELATLVGHEGSVNGVAFLPDGARLATTGDEDFSIRIWDLPEVRRVAP